VARELGEHERLSGNGLGAGPERVAREGENEQSGADPSHTGRLSNRPSKIGCRSCEVPDAVCDHEIAAAVPGWKHVHAREDEAKVVAESIVPHALGGRAQHRP
jgi:hypothetical protein